MYEGNYCQHKALKPADFKLNSVVLWCLHHSGDTASHGVDGVQQLRPGTPQPPCTTEPIPQLEAPTQHTQARRSQYVLVLACLGKKKNVQIIITLEYNANQKKKKKKSNQHKVEKQSQLVVTLFRLASRPRVWHSLFTSVYNWLFLLFLGIHITIVLPFARQKAKL